MGAKLEQREGKGLGAEVKAVVILLDTLNRHMLECYNREAGTITPNLSRLAEKCVVFDNHWAGSLPCMPARRDILTGRLSLLERGWGGVEPFDVTLPQVLKSKQVFSHIVTDHYHYFKTGGENYCQAFSSWDLHRGQESDPWVSRVQPPAPPEQPYYGRVEAQYEKNRTAFKREEDYPGPRTMQAACRWLEDNEGADSYFLMVEAFDPHEPFDCPQPYLDLYQDDYTGPRFEWPKYAKAEEPPEAMAHLRKRYAANLTMIDHWLGKLLDVMDRQQLWDDTLVIVTSDHGFLLGEHEWTGKNIMHVYNEIAHLPLMVHVPGAAAGAETEVAEAETGVAGAKAGAAGAKAETAGLEAGVAEAKAGVAGAKAGTARLEAGAAGAGRRWVSALTQNIDLMPTLLDFFGIDIPPTVRGRSLLGLVRGTEQKLRDYALYGMFGMTVNVTDGHYAYMRAPMLEDNHPCYMYTAMPTTFGMFVGGQQPKRIEAGRYLPYTRYPVYRIPVSQEGVPFRMGQHGRKSLLYDLEADYGQMQPVEDEALIGRYTELLIEAMEREQAPAEQYVRLGLRQA